mmetsp:Transcript_62/g.93  ORF Transcript_62/g.93 Transcript_62/m.93 type:complete len:219 (+) Transcript_62:731-1387(+)
MWLMKPTSSYCPGPSSTRLAAAGPAPPAALPAAGADRTDATAESRSSMWLNSQSAARSMLPPQALSAALACWSLKPMPASMDTFSGSAESASAAPAPGPAAPGSGSAGRGSLKSGSSMWASTHSMAASTPELPVASTALLHPISLNPMPTSWLTRASSGWVRAAGGAAAAAAAPVPAASWGCSSSPGSGPVLRRCSRLSWSGTSTSTSIFLGVQSGPT